MCERAFTKIFVKLLSLNDKHNYIALSLRDNKYMVGHDYIF